jgi:hypothetical protein
MKELLIALIVGFLFCILQKWMKKCDEEEKKRLEQESKGKEVSK